MKVRQKNIEWRNRRTRLFLVLALILGAINNRFYKEYEDEREKRGMERQTYQAVSSNLSDPGYIFGRFISCLCLSGSYMFKDYYCRGSSP